MSPTSDARRNKEVSDKVMANPRESNAPATIELGGCAFPKAGFV
jgi:hypothetical protein